MIRRPHSLKLRHFLSRFMSCMSKELLLPAVKAAGIVKLGSEDFKAFPYVLLFLLWRANRRQNEEWFKTLPTTFTVDPERAASHFRIGRFAKDAFTASAVDEDVDAEILDRLGELFSGGIKHMDLVDMSFFLTVVMIIEKFIYIWFWFVQPLTHYFI